MLLLVMVDYGCHDPKSYRKPWYKTFIFIAQLKKLKIKKKKSLKVGRENNPMKTHPLSLEFCTSMC